uniref:hypothetical protein n=1 Tax=Mariniflexile sp. TaxID=1979402 RepID=UPI00404888CC
MGDEFMGLSGTLQSLLSFLSLVELGIGTAVSYAIYKPQYNHDHQEINNIISLLGHLYKKVGLIVLAIAIVLSLFFPLIFSTLTLPLGIAYLLFYAYLLTSLLNYFYNYNILILQADQRSYVITTYYVSLNLTKVVLQTLIAYYFKSFVLWIVLDIIFSVTNSLLLRRRVAKDYAWVQNNTDNKYLIKKYPHIIQKIKQISVHKFSAFVLNGTDQLLIFAFVSIQSVAFFGNYQLILSNFAGFLKNLSSGVGAGVGNLVAEDNKVQINNIFRQTLALNFFIAGFSSIILYYTVEPFIVFWIGDKYILDKNILILMLVNLFITQIRGSVDSFIQAYGLFGDTWAPITESVLNLVISLIFVQFWGIAGIMLGTAISLISIVLIWKPYYLFKKGFHEDILVYWINFSKLLFVFVLSYFLVAFLKNKFVILQGEGFLELVFFGIKLAFLTAICYGSILYLSNRDFKNVALRLYNLLIKKF